MIMAGLPKHLAHVEDGRRADRIRESIDREAGE
jgi:hypothetical protein